MTPDAGDDAFRSNNPSLHFRVERACGLTQEAAGAG
jgi:hypothetical protein